MVDIDNGVQDSSADSAHRGDAEGSTGSARSAGSARLSWSWLGLVPFAGYVAVFFLLPTGVIGYSAFRRTDPDTNVTSFTLGNLADSVHGAYLTALEHSLQLALVTSVISAALGLVLAHAVATSKFLRFKQLVSTVSAVLANFGGLPLAFLFVAAVGSAGVLTTQLQERLGVSLRDDLHFDLYSLTGVEFVYLYFLIPLMVLVITPALGGLRPQWQEAAQNLGASRWQYWRHIAAPVLAPSFFGSVALLFASSLSAFATASALTNGTLAITPLQIDSAVSGNVLTGQENLAAALALDMIAIVVPLTVLYLYLQRRTSKWLQ